MKLSKDDKKWLVTTSLALILGLMGLWATKMSNPINHIKFIYSSLLVVAISIAVYLIIFEKKKVKRNGKKK